jgi:uncharacterized protein involved in exopolysaccharide biosynthesis
MEYEYSRSSLLSSWKRIARRWKPSALVFLVMFLWVALLALALPNKYQSRFTILVKNARLNPIVGMDQQTQGVIYVDDVSEARINTEIELLTSADVLRDVVARCHLGDFVKSAGHSRQTRDELALRQLQKDLSVSAVRKSDVIQASYQSTDPRRAEAVMQALSDAYLQAHLKIHGSPDSYKFFRNTSESYASQLIVAELNLADFRREHHIIALSEEKSLALQQATELENSLAASSAATQRSAEKASHLQRLLLQIPASVETEHRSLPNQTAVEQLGVLLVTLKNKRAELVQRYLPEDRIVKEIDTQIAQTETALEAARDNKAQEVTTATNPTLLQAQSEHLQASADFAGSRAQTREIADELKANRIRLRALDAATVPYQALERRVAQLQELTTFYKKKSDEALINDLLDKQHISNVTIAEHPRQAELPSSPKRGLILALGFIWSLLAAVGTAFVLDLLTERIVSPYELQQLPGLPVLASLPASALAPNFGGAFPAVYLSMQRRIGDSIVRLP